MKRWPLIRHIRCFYLSYKLGQHVSRCSRLGIGFVAQQSDIDYLDAVWEGRE